MQRIIALFASQSDAYRGVRALYRCGFPLDEIEVAITAGSLAQYAASEEAQAIPSIQGRVFAGAIGALGGVLGLIAGAGGAMPRATGPLYGLGIVFALAMAAVGIAIGVAAGRLIGEHDGRVLVRRCAKDDPGGGRQDGVRVAVEAEGDQADCAITAIRETSPLTVSIHHSAHASPPSVALDPALAERFAQLLDQLIDV